MYKPKIIVHSSCNDVTRYIRNYNYFWDRLTDYLKIYFEVEENRFFENADKERRHIKLDKGISNDFLVLDCEYIIENKENGEFHILSVSDILTHSCLNERANPYCKTILFSQFHPKNVEIHVKEYFYKYKPWVYFQCLFQDLDMWYYKRQYIKEKSNTLYFRGTSHQDRTFLSHLDPNFISNLHSVDSLQYFNELINHKLALSIDGRGEFCYRDIECFACGVPIIRFEYESVLAQPLIPNYHYISIPRPSDMKLYRLGSKEHADILMKKYFEVINNEELLNFISKNAREYYEKNLTFNNILKNTHSLLNLNSWL